MKRVLLTAALTLTGLAALGADEIEPLEADFLEYLANLEGDDDNWTLLSEPEEQSMPAEGEQRAPDAKVREPSKEAAKPAVEKR